MRRIIYPVVVLIAAIMVGTALLILRPESLWVPAVEAITGKSRAKPEARPSPLANAKAVAKSRPVHPQPGPDESEGSVTVNVIPLPVTEKPPRRFPLAQDVVKGMTKSAVLASYDAPEATVTGADVGHLMERLIYLDSSSRRRTLIYFVDGKVTRAETDVP